MPQKYGISGGLYYRVLLVASNAQNQPCRPIFVTLRSKGRCAIRPRSPLNADVDAVEKLNFKNRIAMNKIDLLKRAVFSDHFWMGRVTPENRYVQTTSGFSTALLVLLCHIRRFISGMRPQHGQSGRRWANSTAISQRSVAIESATCRCGLTGAPRRVTFG